MTGGKKMSLVIIVLAMVVIFFMSAFLPSAAATDKVFLEMAAPIPEPIRNFIFCSLTAVILVTFTSVFFIRKLRRMNRLLAAKNNEIEKAMTEQAELNAELSRQRDTIARELADSEKLYAILIESASDGISFYDSNDKIILANTAFYSLLDMTREEYNAADPEEFLHPDSKSYMSMKASALKESGSYLTEIRLRHKSGHYIVLSSRTVEIRNDKGEVIGSLSISRDITDLKKTQQELIDAKEMAEASNRLKTSFLANISHEIRTPLNSVVGFSNLLMMSGISDEQRSEYIEHINSNSEKLLQIIGDIIDLARLENSQLELSNEEASVNDIVLEIVTETRTAIKSYEKPIRLIVNNGLGDISDLVITDRMWLKRVLRHLLDNAVKFTLEGEVELSYSLMDNDLLFKVRDTGIGINEENLERIFEQFNQEVSGHHRPFEGLGLGLSLAKQVLDRLGGHIYVSSVKGNGSVFSFTIPYRPVNESYARELIDARVLVPAGWSNIRCLVVDDNKDVLLYLTRILLDTGIQTVTAGSGKEALEQLRNDSAINMILLDMQMPEMTGVETAIEIRKIRSSIPIIAQTAFVFDDDKNEVIKAGCDACLAKPIRRDNLITVMSAFTSNN